MPMDLDCVAAKNATKELLELMKEIRKDERSDLADAIITFVERAKREYRKKTNGIPHATNGSFTN